MAAYNNAWSNHYFTGQDKRTMNLQDFLLSAYKMICTLHASSFCSTEHQNFFSFFCFVNNHNKCLSSMQQSDRVVGHGAQGQTNCLLSAMYFQHFTQCHLWIDLARKYKNYHFSWAVWKENKNNHLQRLIYMSSFYSPMEGGKENI